MKPQSPTRLVTKAFLPAEAFAGSVCQNEMRKYEQAPDALPPEERDQQVVAEHQHQHREDEQVEVEEELGVLLVALHVPDRVQVDQGADAGDEEAHRDAERIGQEAHRHLEVAGRDPGEQRLVSVRSSAGRGQQVEERRDDHGERTADRGRGEPPGAGSPSLRPPTTSARKPASGRAGMSQSSCRIAVSPSSSTGRRRWRRAGGA